MPTTGVAREADDEMEPAPEGFDGWLIGAELEGLAGPSYPGWDIAGTEGFKLGCDETLTAEETLMDECGVL